jgi:hypothetical protein
MINHNYILIVNRFIEKKGLEPGPGDYNKIDVVGNTSASKLTSHIPTSIANSFSKAKDRFVVPSNRFFIFSNSL